jgi:hypothetical protein
MKIYKISQSNPDQTLQIQQEITKASHTIQTAIANINKALQILESSNILSLLNRTQIVSEIQSNNIVNLDPNSATESLKAIQSIIMTIPSINNAKRILEGYNVNYTILQQGMVEAIQSNSWDSFQAAIASFQQNAPAMGNL